MRKIHFSLPESIKYPFKYALTPQVGSYYEPGLSPSLTQIFCSSSPGKKHFKKK